MLRKNSLQKFLTTLTAIAVMCVYSNVAFAQADDMGSITVTGNVSVNGQPAVSSGTVVTGSKITSGANSGAVVSFGKNGSIELFEDTTIDLKFTSNSIVAMLTQGKIKVMNAPGVGATVTTRTATATGDTGRANSFVVSLGCADDKDCQETFVETFAGLVTLTTNSDQTIKQVPAGASASSGDACSKACVRPGALLPIALADGINTGLLAALFGGIGAAVIAAVLLGSNDPVIPGGNVPVVSPSS